MCNWGVCKGRESKDDTYANEDPNQLLDRVHNQEHKKDSYSDQCEAGWNQGMIMSTSERPSDDHE